MLWFNRNKLVMSTLVISAVSLGGCGFSPLYGQKRNQPYMEQALASISVSRIPDHVGQMLRQEILQRIAPKRKRVAPIYTLSISLSESIGQLSVDQSGFASRANLNLTAAYIMTKAKSAEPVIEGNVATVASYNILSSDFATLSAEENARKLAVKRLAELLQTRLAVHFKISAPEQPASRPSNPNGINYGYPN